MASAETIVDVPALIDGRRIGRFQFLVVALCALIVFLDGFDTQAIGYVAPSIARDWQLQRAALTPIFVASLVGLMIGALFFGPVADKIGRRTVLIVCTLIFGFCTLLTATAHDVTGLLVFRFLTGLGLGGAMPNAIALTAEYCPRRRRATLVMIMFCGFSLGAALGGVLAARLIPTFGWRSVFYVGGALPVLVTPLLFFVLPESIRFLVLREAGQARIAGLLGRIDPGFRLGEGMRFELGEERARGVPVAHLFRGGRAFGTILLWIMFFTNLLDLFFLQNWLPTIISDSGISIETAVITTALFQAGGVTASLLMGWPIDRFGPYRILALLYATAGVFIALIGMAAPSVTALMLATFGAGFGVVGAQNSANALAATFYPTAMRSTGVGWSLGVGRVGSIIGPLVGGWLLALQWPTPNIFVLAAFPVLCAAAAVFTMGRRYPRDAGDTALAKPVAGLAS